MMLRGLLILASIAMLPLLVASQLPAGDKIKPDEPKKTDTKKDDAKKDDAKKDAPIDIVIDAELIKADLFDKVLTGSHHKSYVVAMKQGRTYQIDMITPQFDAFLRLENPKGTQVAADDDSGGNLNSRIIYRAPESGDYTICAMSLGSGSTGKFRLMVKELVPVELKAIQLKNEKGQATFNGNLVANDAKYQNKISKVFSFKMEAGKTYEINHISKDFDAYLYLEGPDGQILAQDDDGGEGLNSRIVQRVEKAGEYRIIATSLSGSRTGEFSLSVRESK